MLQPPCLIRLNLLSVKLEDRNRLLHESLKKWFGFDSLRPLQKDAVDAALDGRDALVVLPTGGGKSLCYQLPPLVLTAAGAQPAGALTAEKAVGESVRGGKSTVHLGSVCLSVCL